MNQTMHDCGGTILQGQQTDNGHCYYCDTCGAFRYVADSEPVTIPTSVDTAAIREAYDAGDIASPDDNTTVDCAMEANAAAGERYDCTY